LLVGTDHTMIRIYDINAEKPFVFPNEDQNHYGPINMIRYTSDGKIYASCSKDGSVKLWDGVSNHCLNTIPNAHNGMEVCTVQFSRNRKYLLTCGKDAWIFIWDLATGRKLQQIYTGSQQFPKWERRLQAVFSYNEEQIICPEEGAYTCVIWDTRTGEPLQRLAGHNGIVRSVASSPSEPQSMTCSEDFRARFWVEDNNQEFN